jgi:hypothetical protein
MRSRFGKAFWAFSVAVMMLLVFGQSALAEDQYRSPLEGVWQITVTLKICGTENPVPGIPPFASLGTFVRGGTVAEDTTNPSFAPGQRSPGQGVWWRTSYHVFHERSVAFINFGTPGPPPLEAGTQALDQTITYNDRSDTWSAIAAITFKDTNGNVYRTGCATATATRF